MNQRDITFLTNSFPRYYGRIDTTQIDIKQMTRCIERSGIVNQNPFLAYAITEKSDEEKKQDVINFNQLMNRLNNTLLAKNDSMTVQTILKTLDKDQDGYIGIQDIVSMNSQLGTMIGPEKLSEILQKITQQGTKISKIELAALFF